MFRPGFDVSVDDEIRLPGTTVGRIVNEDFIPAKTKTILHDALHNVYKLQRFDGKKRHFYALEKKLRKNSDKTMIHANKFSVIRFFIQNQGVRAFLKSFRKKFLGLFVGHSCTLAVYTLAAYTDKGAKESLNKTLDTMLGRTHKDISRKRHGDISCMSLMQVYGLETFRMGSV